MRLRGLAVLARLYAVVSPTEEVDMLMADTGALTVAGRSGYSKLTSPDAAMNCRYGSKVSLKSLPRASKLSRSTSIGSIVLWSRPSVEVNWSVVRISLPSTQSV